MKKSLKAFMRDIIDYAGLFPPAELSLDKAIHNYATYRKSEESWMLSRFIIPAAMLEKLEPYGEELFSNGEPFRFSVLGKGTETVSEFSQEIEDVGRRCRDFQQQHGGRASTGIVELKLPREAALSGDSELVTELLEQSAQKLVQVEGGPEALFVEGYFEESWKKDLETILKGISAHQKGSGNYSGKSISSGFKLRCGGVEAHMFPTVEQVARSINTARKYDVPMKCTAGLHHPLRHYNGGVQTKMHGFLNVFGGAMLAYAHHLSDEELIQVLDEEDPDHFNFSDEAFSWKELDISTEEIREIREVALLSYGSCSFDEPREDLQSLGLL